MADLSNYQKSLSEDYKIENKLSRLSNPLSAEYLNEKVGLSNYSQEMLRPKYDKDVEELAETVRLLNNMAPTKMPEYNFNTEEINGERYKRPDGTLLLIREYDTDIIRDYYVSQEDVSKIGYIKEHDKISGRIRTKIEPIARKGSQAKTNITIFDEKINNKYTIFQLADDGVVINITEFSGKGKSFKTLFRNVLTIKPVRYLEGKDRKEGGFEMIDCIFGTDGSIARIKRYNNKKEVNISYTDVTKTVSVKTNE